SFLSLLRSITLAREFIGRPSGHTEENRNCQKGKAGGRPLSQHAIDLLDQAAKDKAGVPSPGRNEHSASTDASESRGMGAYNRRSRATTLAAACRSISRWAYAPSRRIGAAAGSALSEFRCGLMLRDATQSSLRRLRKLVCAAVKLAQTA